MGSGRFVDSIRKKRRGMALTVQEIQEMIVRYVAGDIPDYQMSAMLMAICFQGMNDEELTTLTMAMRDSGEVIDLSAIAGVKVDKHSTGGVGDKTTLIVGPIVAACGVPVAKMSGRGLGFTGGTLDKLESIPGFRVSLSGDEFVRTVRENGISVIGQTENLAPADKALYALRDVTGTVDSIPLIAASIMSKKLAAGSDKILLDVTTGSGAFIKEREGSLALAKRMVAIGKGAGKETAAMLTSMDEPLGEAVGNNLEVIEALQTLQGYGAEDVKEVCLALAGMMLSLAKTKEGETALSFEEGKEEARAALESGRAFAKFRDMVRAQGGDVRYIDEPERFEKAEVAEELTAQADGYIVKMNTEGFGIAAGMLGAGRETKESTIDNSAGILVKKKTGDYVKKGDVLAVCCGSRPEQVMGAAAYLQDCIVIGPQQPEPLKLIVDIIR